MPASQFNPQYYQAPQPQQMDQGLLAQVQLQKNAQRNAAIMALGQLAQENQKIAIARDELTRKIGEDVQTDLYHNEQLRIERERNAITERIATMGQTEETKRAHLAVEGAYGLEGMREASAASLAGGEHAAALELAQLGERGANSRALMGLFESGADRQSRERMQGKQLGADAARQAEQLTAGSWESQQDRESRERIAAKGDEAHLAATQMQVEGRTVAAANKFASRPFHYGGKEYTIPEGERAQRAWARQRAFDELSQTGQHKDGKPVEDAEVESYASKFIDPQLGLEPMVRSPHDIQVQASEDAEKWAAEESAKRGKPVSPKEHYEYFERRMGELGMQPEQGPPTGEAQPQAPADKVKELASSPLASDQRRAKRMEAEQKATETASNEQFEAAREQYERIGDRKAPKDYEDWVQAHDELLSREDKGASYDVELEGLDRMARARGWKMPKTKAEWDAVIETLKARPKKD